MPSAVTTTKDPLSRYRALHTSRIDELERGLISVFGAAGVSVEDPSALRARSNFIELHDIALGFAACGTNAKFLFGETDYARMQLPLRGLGMTTSGKRQALLRPGCPCVATAGRPAILEYSADFENVFVRAKSQAIERRLTLLIGAPLARRLEFELAEFESPALLAGQRRIVEMLVQQLDDKNALLSPLVMKEIEEIVILQLLFLAKHNYSRLLEREPRDIDPAHVRRVEAFIEANWHQPITIESLVDVAGVSARTLFRAFEKSRGFSPMALVRKFRLEQAQLRLSQPDDRTSVTGVALVCGFSNLGQFARDYRSAFGELPSQTLRRGIAGK